MSSTLNDVTVISVTFNSAHCIAAMARQLADFPHVFIVDNASNDGTGDRAAQLLPHAALILNERNIGFGSANNQALRKTRTLYALLLNPDCEVTPDAVRALMKVADENPGAAIVAPQLMRNGDKPEVNYRWPANEWASTGPGAEGVCCVGFACGAALLLNMRLMSEVGFFDEDFLLYYEDDDLCRRVFDRGFEILLAPQVKLLHSSRGSVRGKHPLRAEYIRGYHHAQSKIFFTKKYQGEAVAERLRKKVLISAIAAMPLRVLAFSPSLIARMAGRIAGLWRPR